jgi:hypothetical protein
LLVGKTALDSNVAGSQLGATGTIAGTRSSEVCIIGNRLTTDGDIASFRKDGTIVGSIGVVDGNDIYITSDNVALRLGLGSSAGGIYPANSNGTVRDNATNLGGASERFKDLYLSGGVYLGGTAAANQLDDYEEGTFTPIFAGGTTAGTYTYSYQIGRYTKIGNIVHVTISLVDITTSVGGSGDVTITNLPFASANIIALNTTAKPFLSRWTLTGGGSDDGFVLLLEPNSTICAIIKPTTGASGTGYALSVSDKASNLADIFVSFSYRV